MIDRTKYTAIISTDRPPWVSRVIQLLMLVLAALIMSTSAANAEEEQSTGDQAYAECISRVTDKAAIDQMIDEGTIDDPGDGWENDMDLRSELIRENQERADELKEHYESDQSVSGKAGRTLNSSQCQASKIPDTITKEMQNKASEYWDTALGEFVEGVMEGNAEALKTVMTFWLDVGINSDSTTGFGEAVTNIFYPVASALFVISFMVCGTTIAVKRREGLGDGIETAGGFVGKYLIFGGMVPAAVPVALMGSDYAAKFILDEFLPQDQTMDELFDSIMLSQENFGPWLMLLIMLFSTLGSIMQIIALAIRTLVLPIAMGFLPIYAAGIQLPPAKQSLMRLLAWGLAAVAMPVMAAVVYVVAFWIAGDPETTGSGNDTLSMLMRVLVLGSAGYAPLSIVALFAAFAGGTGGNRSGALGAMGAGAVGGALGSIGTAMASGGNRGGGDGGNGSMGATGGPTGPGGNGGGGAGGGATGATGAAAGGKAGASPSGSGSTSGAGASPSGSGGAGAGAGRSGGGAGGTSGGAGSSATPSGSSGGGGGVATAMAAAGQVAQTARAGVHDMDTVFDDSVGSVPDGGVIRK